MFINASECPFAGGGMCNGVGPNGTLISVITSGTIKGIENFTYCNVFYNISTQ
jgi:hypothetical protein